MSEPQVEVTLEFGDEEPNQDQDAGVGGAEVEYDTDPFAEGEDG
jgi:hypothetical protein